MSSAYMKRKSAAATTPITTGIKRNIVNSNLNKKQLTKPAWDQTNSNLEQFKPSQEELEKRRQTHLSKNIDVIKTEKQRQSILKAKQQTKSATHLDTKTQLALLKEILLDDNQLKNLLLKSDDTLKTASHLIENDNFLNKGHKSAKIHLTLAPNADLNESNLPVDAKGLAQLKQQQQHQHQQRHQQQQQRINYKNLNSHSLEDFNENESNDEDTENKSNINELIKYRQMLIEKKALIESQLKKKQVDTNDLKNLNELESYINSELNDNNLFRMLNSNQNQNQPINDTVKVNRIRSRLSQQSQSTNDNHRSGATSSPPPQLHSLQTHTGTLNLNDFKKVLEELEIQLVEYEEQFGRQVSAQRISKYDTYSSYTISLVNVVSALLHHLKQTTFELNYEKQKLMETTKQLDIHRKLIDGLTTEILSVKSQNEKILNEFATYEAKIETDMDQIKFALRNSMAQQSDHTSRGSSIGQQQSLLKKQSVSSHNLRQQTSMLSPLNSNNNDYDHFSERLNAMLQSDIMPGQTTQLHQQQQQALSQQTINSSRSAFNVSKLTNLQSQYHQQTQQSNFNKNYESASLLQQINYNELSNGQYLSNRPSSAQAVLSTNSNINNLLNANKHLIYEYNSQIQDLSTKNFETQQKLKNLQQNDNEFSLKFPDSMQHFETIENGNTLNKLKEDQQLLKEQIYLLNRQREYAQRELDTLVTNNNGTTTTTVTTASLHSLNTIGLSSNGANNRSSPNLSPIPTENNYSDAK